MHGMSLEINTLVARKSYWQLDFHYIEHLVPLWIVSKCFHAHVFCESWALLIYPSANIGSTNRHHFTLFYLAAGGCCNSSQRWWTVVCQLSTPTSSAIPMLNLWVHNVCPHLRYLTTVLMLANLSRLYFFHAGIWAIFDPSHSMAS